MRPDTAITISAGESALLNRVARLSLVSGEASYISEEGKGFLESGSPALFGQRGDVRVVALTNARIGIEYEQDA